MAVAKLTYDGEDDDGGGDNDVDLFDSSKIPTVPTAANNRSRTLKHDPGNPAMMDCPFYIVFLLLGLQCCSS